MIAGMHSYIAKQVASGSTVVECTNLIEIYIIF
jgi:hypothetical protein